jgi:hypothetical protein
MWRDEIVEEIHKYREEYAAKFDYDIRAIFEDLKRKQEESRREYVSFSAEKTDAEIESSETEKKAA